MSVDLKTIKLPGIAKPELVRPVLQAVLDAVDPIQSVKKTLRSEDNWLKISGREYDLKQYQRIFLIGFGKASLGMSSAVAEILGSYLTSGRVVVKHMPVDRIALPERVEYFRGSHPVPDQNSVMSASKVVELIADANEKDLVICVISGGGSALFTLPEEGISLDDLQELTRLLLASGADIGEMNALRKHLDRVKGGGLAKMVYPATLVTLILSDVIGNPLDVIASGPTVGDSSTYQDCIDILNRYKIWDRAPESIRQLLSFGVEGRLDETAKPGDPEFRAVQNTIIASNQLAADAAIEAARQVGFHTMLLTTYLKGEARQAGSFMASLLKQIEATGQPVSRPALLVAGGETTVTLTGNGKGGRNQEVALGAAIEMSGIPDAVILTLGTDGEDGPTDAAGAIVTNCTVQEGIRHGISAQSYLANNDSYHFFQQLNSLLITGPTGTNVNDLTILIAF